MKRMLILIVLVAVGVLVVDQLGDATQTRDDERSSDRKTQVVIHIEGKHYRQSLDTAAQALYASCTATVGGELVDPGIEKVGDGEYRFAMTPSLGEHGKERLLGCLNDLGIDRLKSNVQSVEELPLRVAA
jgi:hypothetical protein